MNMARKHVMNKARMCVTNMARMCVMNKARMCVMNKTRMCHEQGLNVWQKSWIPEANHLMLFTSKGRSSMTMP